MCSPIETKLMTAARKHAALAVFWAGLLVCQPLAAQIDTDSITRRPPVPPIGEDISSEHRPSGLSLTDLSVERSDFFGGGSVSLALSVEVANNGDANGDYLLLVDVQGSDELFSSKPQHVRSGETQEVSLKVTRNFSCQGATRFSFVVKLVDRWTGTDRRGLPLNTREVDQAVGWVDASPEKFGKGTLLADCTGRDPFDDGLVIDDGRSAPIMTPFDPDEHGFEFGNTFRNDWIPEFDAQTGGLCGGMMYTALDYYYAGTEIPQQSYRPADHTPLYRYLITRQEESIRSNLDHWFELRQNPGGVRNTTFFNWGLNERLADVRDYIDRGEPALLGLKGANGSGDHQVLAIGYFVGRDRADTKIFVYDPNFPNVTMTLIPHMEREFYHYAELADEVLPDDSRSDDEKVGKYYQSYFVDRNYHRSTPPDIRNDVYPDDGLTYELIVGISTAGDDLRGGSEVDVHLRTRDGGSQLVRNINGGKRWIEDYTQFIRIELDEPTRYRNLKDMRFDFRSGGSGTNDNWDVRKIWVSARGHDRRVVYEIESTPLIRFTGQRKSFTAYLDTAIAPDRHVKQVELTLRTGGDDLRGGNDNLDAHILFADGTEQFVPYVNNFHPLRNNTTLTYPVVLEEPRPRDEIRGIRLVKSRGNDNWNLDILKVDFVPVRGLAYTRFIQPGRPLVRFTGSDRTREFLFDPT